MEIGAMTIQAMNDTEHEPACQAPIAGIARHRLATDGEGVTTLVAFQGCPLRCRYCLNPQTIDPNLQFKHYTPEALYEHVRMDELYFMATHGGVTFGGGEPACRTDFIIAFRALCGSDWSITVETSLNVPLGSVKRLLPVVNFFIIDIKDMDSEIYQAYCGASNRQVIENLTWLAQEGMCDKVMVRVPHIPGYNDERAIKNSLELLKKMGYGHFDQFQYRCPTSEDNIIQN